MDNLTAIMNGDAESINRINRETDVAKAQMSAMIYEYAKREMKQLVTLMNLYEEVTAAYQAKITQEIEDGEISVFELAKSMEMLAGNIDRILTMYGNLSGEKAPEVVYIDQSINTQNNVFKGFEAESPASRQKIREAIFKIINSDVQTENQT